MTGLELVDPLRGEAATLDHERMLIDHCQTEVFEDRHHVRQSRRLAAAVELERDPVTCRMGHP